jgi:Lon protease-like protein
VTLLPLFSLENVLLPGIPLPLRIFEPRYVQLFDDIGGLRGSRRFGVVALTAGREVAHRGDAAPRFASVGTVAEIVESEVDEKDGTLSVLTTGSERFRIKQLVETGKPYPVAEVEFLAERNGVLPADLVDTTRELVRQYLTRFGDLQNVAYSIPDYPADLALLAYRLVAEAPLSRSDQQALLEDPTTGDRLRRLRRLVRHEIALLRRTRTVPAGRELLHRGLCPN